MPATRAALRNLKRAEADERHFGVPPQAVGNGFFHCVDGALGFGLADGSRIRNLLDQIALIHRAS